MKRCLRLMLLLVVALSLSGCWFVVRFVDDSALTLDPRFQGRWTLADGSGELVIAAGSGCGLVQFIAEDDSLRLCSLGGAGDYVLTAFYDLSAEDRSVREYTIGVARWYADDRVGLVMLDAQVALDELAMPYAHESRDPACAQRPADEQQQSGCSRLLVDLTALPAVTDTTLATLYRTGCCTDDDDESILVRTHASGRATRKE